MYIQYTFDGAWAEAEERPGHASKGMHTGSSDTPLALNLPVEWGALAEAFDVMCM
jgi:hypothetical protein